MTVRWLLSVGVFLLSLLATEVATAAEDDLYEKRIKPLLKERCGACHGALKQEGGLRLDAAALIRRGGESGQLFAPGKPAGSLLLEKVSSRDPDVRMPPMGKPLSPQQVGWLRDWIASGASAPANEPVPQDPDRHWAFQPLASVTPPAPRERWMRNEIDVLLDEVLRSRGLAHASLADPATRLRRVHLDLIGLPPSADVLRAFLHDPSPAAYARIVDRLLASPQYGQRWARHWMDVWRYSDPSGYGKEIRDGREHIWRWRDWIVESLNQDKGYDRMVVEMLAGDEAYPDDIDALRATGFLARNWYKFNRNVWLDNIVEHSSKAFLGLTTNCARCHDHKYDPLTQAEYYQLRAVFETHDLRDDRLGSGTLVRAFDAHFDRPTYLFLQGDERKPDRARALPPKLPKRFGKMEVKPVELPVAAFYPALLPAAEQQAVAAAEQAAKRAADGIWSVDQRLAQLQQLRGQLAAKAGRRPAGKPKAATDKATAGALVFQDRFAKLDDQHWRAESGAWNAGANRLRQTDGETIQHRLVLQRIQQPRDFQLKVKLQITGGRMWRSVGVGFDGRGKAMNAVYLSAFGGGSKVQGTLQDAAGSWSYPAAAAKSLPVELNRKYQLEIRVRGSLLNVLIDNRLAVAYRLPASRAPGDISLWTFSATAIFEDFELRALGRSVAMKNVGSAPTSPGKPHTLADAEEQLLQLQAQHVVAQQKQEAAEATLRSLKARYAADKTRYGLLAGDRKQRAHAAAQAERAAEIATARSLIAASDLDIQENKPLAAHDKAAAKRLAAAKKTRAAQMQRLKKAEQRKAEDTSYQPVGKVFPRRSSGRRLAFARWITSPQNPLAARVAVNHIWLRHFDGPLVERMFDFGMRSPQPVHARLLDYLANRLRNDGWSMKRLHRLIVTSAAYQFSSSPTSAAAKNRSLDPDNRLFWRQNVRRMEAEVVRDSLLCVGGSLDLTGGGPPIDHQRGQTNPRRSLYFRQDKERQMVFLSLFDGAKVNECYRRKPTVAPQQALAMYNSQIAETQARRIATRLSKVPAPRFVESLFEQILCRKPTGAEATACGQFLSSLSDPARARKQLALVLLNHNDFITIR